VLVLLVLTVLPARAQDQNLAGNDQELADDVKSIPTNIEWMQRGGSWRAGEQEGEYRVVTTVSGFEHLNRDLFIQWIAQPKDVDEAKNTSDKIVRTLEVKELGYVWTISPQLKFAPDGKLQINLAIKRPDGLHDNGVREKRKIIAWPDGHYDFK
jgi:hypothetical protein